jgi:hypothetical protein
MSPNAEDRLLPFANMLTHHATMSRIYREVPAMRLFLGEHMEIAFDHSGNDLCLNLQNGRILLRIGNRTGMNP